MKQRNIVLYNIDKNIIGNLLKMLKNIENRVHIDYIYRKNIKNAQILGRKFDVKI